MAITTTSLLPPPVQQSFSYKLLSVPTPYMIHKFPAMKKQMPRNGGNTIRFRRPNPLLTAKVPLGNSGAYPSAQVLTALDIDAKIDFYGTYVMINEQVTLTSQDAPLNEAAKRLGVSLRQTEDELMRDMLAGTANAYNCSGGGEVDVPQSISVDDLTRVATGLVGANAFMISQNIEGEDKIGTMPIADAFFGLCHTDLIPSLHKLEGFTPKYNYPAPEKAIPSEWGAFRNIRFFVSSIGSKDPVPSTIGLKQVYNIFVLGREAVAAIEQDGYSAQFIYRPPIYDGPLALNVTVGYKFAECPRILNDLWLTRVRAILK